MHRSLSPLHYPPPPPAPPTIPKIEPFNLDSKISPSILLIIVILAIIFFVSGLLHLLVRFLLRAPSRDPDELDDVTALQGQLQQLFHLHDAGVDQSFIDTLPVFLYKAIIGLKDPFDCAVCLCEFEPEDKLRLLPRCSHAFHMECIDTWLLAHSTCPLCRASLIPDFTPACGGGGGGGSPIVFVLESGSDSSLDLNGEAAANGHTGRTSSVLFGSNSHLGIPREAELGSTRFEFSRKSCEICEKNDSVVVANTGGHEIQSSTGEKIVQVKLGKFKNVDGAGEGSSIDQNNNNVDSRRCYSMGSFAYVMDEASSLRVPIRTPLKKMQSSKKNGFRGAVSEYGSDSRRDFNGIDAFKSIANANANANVNSNSNSISKPKRESFSISKIWLRGDKKDKIINQNGDTSNRAVSFRFPSSHLGGRIGERSDRISEIEMDGSSEMGFEETQSCYSLDSQVMAPSSSSHRRTLLWLMGKQNKVVHSSSCSSNV